MVLLFYFVLNAIAVFLFKKKSKTLHILEIIVYWMVSTYLYQNFSALCFMNFKTLHIPNKLSFELSHFLNRVVLVPLLMVTFLDLFIALRLKSKKILLFLCFVLLLTGVEWLADFFGVLKHVNWKIWWSFAYWVVTLLLLIWSMKIFRKLLYKGERTK